MKNKGRKYNERVKETQRFTVINAVRVLGDGQQQPGTTMKFVDTALVAQNITSTGTITTVFNITQGVGVSQRVGDSAFIDRMWLNYQIDAINADVFSTGRLIIFQWHPNTALATPTVNQVLQTATLQAFYNYQFSNQYVILYDAVHALAGTATGPCDSGNQSWFGKISLKNCVRKVEWNPAAVNGSNQFYALTIGDSTIAPFPILNLNCRIMYDDNI